MNIAIVTAHDRNIAEIGALSVHDKQVYCDMHGYSLEVFTDGFDTTRPAAWSKLHFIKQTLPKYDWVVWMDADLLVMNKTITIESYSDNAFDLIMGRYEMNPASIDPLVHYTIHTGCFIIKNSDWIMDFIPFWYNQDQFRFVHLLEEKAFTWLHATKRGVNQHTKLLPLRTFCTMAPHSDIIGTKLAECIYRSGDFIMHFLELSQDKKLSYMRSVFSKIYQYHL